MSKNGLSCYVYVFYLLACITSSFGQGAPPNVLFIAIDDMNDWVGYLKGHPQAHTPHIDALAERGISFTEAHCPAPSCGPSRTAILSGLWPTTSTVYTNAANYKRDLPDRPSLFAHFRKNGYHTMGVGKLFHSNPKNMPDDAFDEYGGKGTSASPFSSKQLDIQFQTPFHTLTLQGKEFTLPLNGIPADRYWKSSHTFDWGAVDLPDSFFADTQATQWAIEKLEESYDTPFFLAIGFIRPHQPLFNPKRFHELYPLSSVVLPNTIPHDLSDVPRAGQELALAAVTSGLHRSVAHYGEWEHATSSYLASISYVDKLVGDILDALAQSPFAENTSIVLWSDHGWHLGEKEHWGKGTGWYRSTHVPFLIVPPTSHKPEGFIPGSKSPRPVNLLDIAPTLSDLSGIPLDPVWEGKSLVPLIKNPHRQWNLYTHTTFGIGNHSITGTRWKYIHYFDGTSELYDLQRDPEEFVNLSGNPQYQSILQQLHAEVPVEPKWKYMLRYHNFKALLPADGSPWVLYNLAFQNHADERTNVADKYPHIVGKIKDWVAKHQPAQKHILIN